MPLMRRIWRALQFFAQKIYKAVRLKKYSWQRKLRLPFCNAKPNIFLKFVPLMRRIWRT